MARLWTCGFELQGSAEWQNTNGAPTIDTTTHRAGTAALRCNPTAGVAGIAHPLFASGQPAGRFFLRAYVRVAAYPSARTAIMGWADNASGSTGFMCIKMNTDGTLIAGGSGATTGTASTVLALDTWYRVEMDYDDATNTINAYLDGALWTTVTSVDLAGGNIARFGVMQTATADIYFDDLAVNDTTGTQQTGLPGAGNVVHLQPAAAGDANDFATTVGGTPGAANNYTRADEHPPDDATSYNETSTAGTTTTDDFALPSAASAGVGAFDTIRLVAVGSRIGSNAITAASLVYRLKSQPSGTVAESPSVPVAVNGWATHKSGPPYTYQLTSYADPQAGGAWTAALLDSAQIGYRADVSQTTVRRVSTLWLLVEFVPAAGVLFEQLTDTFDAATVDTGKWPDNYHEGGGPLPDQVDGRARVPCTNDFAAFASAAAYTLANSQARVRVYPPAVGGATGSVFCQLLVLSDVVGTQIVFEIDVTTNLLSMAVHVDFTDEDPGTLPYDPVAHAWLRIREAAGLLNWETSPDGRTWTTQHTETSPAWVSAGDLQAQLLAFRESGTDDYAYFDNFNVTPSMADGYTVAVDWAGDGDFEDPYDIVTADVLARGAVTFQYGRDQARQLAPPKVGTLAMTLCNADRIYSPENPDSPIGDDMSPAAPVKVQTVYEDVVYPLFTGRVDDLDVHPDRGDRSIDITALDLLSLLQGVKISTELYQSQRTGTLIGVILDAVGWTGPRDLDLGATFVPWWWLDETDAFSALQDLIASEGPPSIAYAGPDGTFIFRDRHHRLLRAASLTSQATFTADAAGECSPVYGYGTGGFGEGGYGGT
jgi:hypothetical protein